MKKIERIQIVEKKEMVFEAIDGSVFRSENDCLDYERVLSRRDFLARNDVITCDEAEDCAPFNGSDNSEWSGYYWYKPTNLAAAKALLKTFGQADVSHDEAQDIIGEWVCVEAYDYENNSFIITTLSDSIQYAKDLCDKLGFELKVTPKEGK